MLVEKVMKTFVIEVGKAGTKETKTKLSDLLDWLIERDIVDGSAIDFDGDYDSVIFGLDEQFSYITNRKLKGKCYIKIYNCPIDVYRDLEDFLWDDRRKWTLIYDVGN